MAKCGHGRGLEVDCPMCGNGNIAKTAEELIKELEDELEKIGTESGIECMVMWVADLLKWLFYHVPFMIALTALIFIWEIQPIPFWQFAIGAGWMVFSYRFLEYGKRMTT